MKKLTPMMHQYLTIKEQYKDALLLFRLGDFYELFLDDAIVASKELEITLTGRDCGLEERAPMCGVPHHSVNNYINKLITKGYKVAICEQIEDASEAKGIVKRDVVRIITPGTLIDTELLEDKKNNYLMCIYGNNSGFGITYVDVSTGELFTTEITQENLKQNLEDEICKLQPKEIIYSIEDNELEDFLRVCEKKHNLYINKYDQWRFEYDYVLKQIKKHFQIFTLDSLGFAKNHLGIYATGGLIDYLKTTQKRALNHLNKIHIYSLKQSMILDITTRRNLELTETIRENKKKGSLLGVLDKTVTSMGGRMLRKWIEEPLIDVDKINLRLDAVESIKEDILTRKELKENLKEIYDLERLCSKIVYGSVNPRDLVALKNSLKRLPNIKNIIINQKAGLLQSIVDEIDNHDTIKDLIEEAILEEPSIAVKEGNVIKDGYNQEVDQLRSASRDGKSWITTLELKEREKTGIKSLKIGYNKVFGYYIEVTRSNLSMVPTEYIRKQTLSNCERYITPDLKEVESKILGSEEKVISLEYQLFNQIRSIIEKEVAKIQNTARAIAQLDTIYSLAEVAYENGYIKPIINNETIISIDKGRHPVIEKMTNNSIFVPNDTYINQNEHEVSIITGPNMAGKSTYMRQVALIVLMAQIGSFISADSGTIGVVDRIFTRVGASDDLSQGQSTFMVEMSEMASILNNATNNSLLILDEIGRGTSTFDGLSIAWSVSEYISKNIKCKTLFSTHYHELTELEGKVKGIKNYRISVKEEGENIVFLRKVVEGSADKSYGIQVAKLAGLPKAVITRAKEILTNLEKNDITKHESIQESKDSKNTKENHQLNFIDMNKEDIANELKQINLHETTPIDALNILYRLQRKANDL
ncbi:DNA mismatch repair protein MutS [Natronincola peptidivorans]|uniref:DNA mismatch repair protein MutS n=2 Tax=Natronincola peptidivorans TaxID=426128 RepID=A0A1H9YL28_9FIRM|nr:DNA mismatch repair protein MutS [Natronincola peptidivorans]SES69675.1 DNA mismatch repair protein MutS [Natronincola peptidivorans]